jgi:hypothetical protein
MADAFLTITFAGTDAGGLILVEEVARLAEACAARVGTITARREAQRASVLTRAGIAALASAATQQAAATLTTSTRGTPMSEPSHEEDFLRILTQAGVLSARVARVALSGGPGTAEEDAAGLRKASYSETTPHDGLLRQLLGEQRWGAYAADPARIAAAAAITDADRAGYDMPALLTQAIGQRRWENDDRSPSRSVARVLIHRVTRAMASTLPVATGTPGTRRTASRTARRNDPVLRPPARDVPHPSPADPNPVLVTQSEGKLRELLGEHRWQQYTADPRRRDVAELISRAHHAGRDVDALLTTAVTRRPFEDDPVSPARNIADVLAYRLQRELSRPGHAGTPELSAQVADLLAHGTAPAGTGPQDPRADPAAHQQPPSTQTAERHARGSR